MPLWTTPPPLGGLLDNSNAAGNNEWLTTLGGLLWDGNRSQASAFVPGTRAAPIVPSDNPSGGLLGRFAGIPGIDPQNPYQFTPSPLDDEQERADLRVLDARFSRTGHIRDAVALYNARNSSRR